MVSPGGVGKSSLAMAAALSLATKRRLIGQQVWQQVNSWVINLDDPPDELDRRFSALRIYHAIPDKQLQGAFFLDSGDDRSLVMATMADNGFDVVSPDQEPMIAALLANDIGFLVVDPFAESHELEENSNPQMVIAARKWREVARAANCAIWLIHHVRKLPPTGLAKPGGVVADMDSSRGAKSLTDSARIGMVLTQMSAEDGQRLGIPETQWRIHLRLDNPKANMAPPAEKATWFKLLSIALKNGTETYPDGDNVQCCVTWEPPAVCDAMTPEEINKFLDLVERGPEPGSRYTKTQQSASRWIGRALFRVMPGLEEKQGKGLLATWFKSGLLREDDYQDPNFKNKTIAGVFVDEDKRPTASGMVQVNTEK
jgi:hypothetical protein